MIPEECTRGFNGEWWMAALTILLLFTSGCTATPPPPVKSAVPDLSSYPWVYLRDGRPLAKNEQTVSVIAVGDTLLGRGVAGESPAAFSRGNRKRPCQQRQSD